MAISFCFNIKNDGGWNPGTIFYYNGEINEIQGLHSIDEYNYIRQTHKETTGLDLVTYYWDANIAPVYVRLFNTLKPGSQNQQMKDALAALEQLARDYIEAFGDPKFFTPKTPLKVVNRPGPEGAIIGTVWPNVKLTVLDAETVCDWHWAKINFNGQTGWVAMADILGNEYGIMSKR